MSNEELSELQDELDGARAELEALQTTAADREARAAHLESQVAQVRDELSQARGDVEEREQRLAALTERAGALEAQVRASAGRYRELALGQSPELPEDLVAGETVEEIEASLGRARETVSKVRGHIESEAQAGRVPVGAPPRRAPDLSGLSPAAKIERGLQQRGS